MKKVSVIKMDLRRVTSIIFVSTNILEESITIQTLRYIIDLGYNLKVFYRNQIRNMETRLIS